MSIRCSVADEFSINLPVFVAKKRSIPFPTRLLENVSKQPSHIHNEQADIEQIDTICVRWLMLLPLQADLFHLICERGLWSKLFSKGKIKNVANIAYSSLAKKRKVQFALCKQTVQLAQKDARTASIQK